MAPGFMYSAYPMHPVFGLGFMMFTWFVQLVIAYFVYKDAKEQNMSAPLWFILVILPMVGFLSFISKRYSIHTTRIPVTSSFPFCCHTRSGCTNNSRRALS